MQIKLYTIYAACVSVTRFHFHWRLSEAHKAVFFLAKLVFVVAAHWVRGKGTLAGGRGEGGSRVATRGELQHGHSMDMLNGHRFLTRIW